MKIKEQKREEAIARQEKYDKLTDRQRVRKLNHKGYVAKKEREKKGFSPLKK